MHYQADAPGDWGSMHAHDSEFEKDRSRLDDDIVTWIGEHTLAGRRVSLPQLT